MTTDATPTDTTTPETAGGYTPPLDASEAEAIDATRQWVEAHIIADNLCPFAAREMARNSIQYAVVPGAGLERCLQALGDELLNLDANRDAETTLVIFKDGFRDFDTYLELLDYAEALLEMQGYEGIYQLASFHPEYVFEDTEEDDAANYTNRSPYPMLHLLRESSVEAAINAYAGDVEEVPGRNEELMRERGVELLVSRLKACAHAARQADKQD
ncbi:DUF1415 domain-containing protein [Cobetia sp. 29-18-1]|uniref:DUF1415 domain-containing protein n=1 Tax=Cobetia sp. 29-18-1 TaxID=3040018 RepID=UPI00244D032F|nr:DUF1415 domain-containing protein [Cobetia sp. 29-18-1]MDH2299743.1 DUF1415 domain-containing protein [Cobetia sp. 29-18-1]